MILTFIVTLITLVGLMVLHEFGHFILAKRFGVKVEEFGIGYPPRLFGKKIGETIYSINLLPFGAFVKMPGEIEKSEDPRSFFKQSVSKRALIAFGGVLSFWIISAIFFSVAFGLGTRVEISDEEIYNLIDPKVQIAAVVPNSPAHKAEIKPGDAILEIEISNTKIKINTVKQLQEIINEHKGEEIILTIERGKKISEINLIPRESPPVEEGPIGVSLARTDLRSYPWHIAFWEGIKATLNFTIIIIQGYWQAIVKASKGLPSGVQLTGPVGIFYLFTQASELGINYYLQFIGLIAIYFAIANVFPIPVLDGGKLLFLGVEAVRKKPISQEIEQKVTNVFFGLLIILMVWVTIKDIIRIF